MANAAPGWDSCYSATPTWTREDRGTAGSSKILDFRRSWKSRFSCENASFLNMSQWLLKVNKYGVGQREHICGLQAVRIFGCHNSHIHTLEGLEQFLSLRSPGIWDQVIPCCEAVRGTVGRSAASLASISPMPVTALPQPCHNNQKMSPDVVKCPLGGKTTPGKSHWTRSTSSSRPPGLYESTAHDSNKGFLM